MVTSESDQTILSMVYKDLLTELCEDPPPDLIGKTLALEDGRFGLIFFTKPFMPPERIAESQQAMWNDWSDENINYFLNYLAFISFQKFPPEIKDEIFKKWGQDTMESLTSKIQAYFQDPRFHPSADEKTFIQSFYHLSRLLKKRRKQRLKKLKSGRR